VVDNKLQVEKKLHNMSISVYFKLIDLLERNQCLLLFFFGISLLLLGTSDIASAQGAGGIGSGYDGDRFGDVCKHFLESHRTGFGSLLTAISGLGAIIASAMGGFKAAWGLLVVSIGSFILNTYKNLWFDGTCA